MIDSTSWWVLLIPASFVFSGGFFLGAMWRATFERSDDPIDDFERFQRSMRGGV
jgi:hypothetical protein